MSLSRARVTCQNNVRTLYLGLRNLQKPIVLATSGLFRRALCESGLGLARVHCVTS